MEALYQSQKIAIGAKSKTSLPLLKMMTPMKKISNTLGWSVKTGSMEANIKMIAISREKSKRIKERYILTFGILMIKQIRKEKPKIIRIPIGSKMVKKSKTSFRRSKGMNLKPPLPNKEEKNNSRKLPK